MCSEAKAKLGENLKELKHLTMVSGFYNQYYYSNIQNSLTQMHIA